MVLLGLILVFGIMGTAYLPETRGTQIPDEIEEMKDPNVKNEKVEPDYNDPNNIDMI